jgi:hypothetical protein
MKFYEVLYRSYSSPEQRALKVLSDLSIKISMFGDVCDPTFIQANNRFQALYQKLSKLLNSNITSESDRIQKCVEYVEIQGDMKELFTGLKNGYLKPKVLH